MTLFAQIESNSWKMFCIGLSIECRLGCRGDSLRTENVNVQQWKGGFGRILRQPKNPETEKCDECKKWIYVVRGLYLFRKRWCPKTFVVDREEMSNVNPKGMVNLVFFKSKAYKINSMSWLSRFGDLQYFLALFVCFQLVSPSGFCWLLRKPHLWGHQNGWYIVYIVYRIYHIKGWVRSVTDCSKMPSWQKLYQCRCNGPARVKRMNITSPRLLRAS